RSRTASSRTGNASLPVRTRWPHACAPPARRPPRSCRRSCSTGASASTRASTTTRTTSRAKARATPPRNGAASRRAARSIGAGTRPPTHAIRGLEETRAPARPFFLFVHYFDPHDPYVPPEPWKSRFATTGAEKSLAEALTKRAQIDAYDGEIAFTDDELGRLLAHLAALGLDRDTLVVVTADHGEGLGQHGVIGHAVNIYEEAVQVPLLLRWSGPLAAGRGVDGTGES